MMSLTAEPASGVQFSAQDEVQGSVGVERDRALRGELRGGSAAQRGLDGGGIARQLRLRPHGHRGQPRRRLVGEAHRQRSSPFYSCGTVAKNPVKDPAQFTDDPFHACFR